MKSYALYAAIAVVFGASLMLPGCESASESGSKTEESTTPSVGQQYGKTLHGAIDQAKGVRNTLERAGQALDHVGDAEK